MTPFEREIDRLPNHLSFFRWLAVRIELADLPQEDRLLIGRGDTKIVEYTEEATHTIVQFIEWAVSVFNVTHPHSTFTPLRIHDCMEAITQIWKKDALECARSRLIPK